MLGTLFNTVLVNPILNIMVVLYDLTGNLGLAIILLTLVIKTLLIPVVNPSLKTMKKQRDLKPELDAIQKKHPNDKKKQAELQMELFKKHNINPASGCLTQIIMFLVLIALFNVIRTFSLATDITQINNLLYWDGIKLSPEHGLNYNFFYLDLTKPDPYYIIAILSGLLQFISSKMMMPTIRKGEKVAQETENKSDDMAYMMQQQSTYMMPIMNVIIGLTLSSGIMLYIVVGTIFSIVQNYFVYGWGDLKPFIKKLKSGTNTSNE